MRVPMAAFALVFAAAAGVAHDFRVAELVTYSGTVPCADCVGIKYLLTLRPDGRFYRQRTYLHSETTGQAVLDVGAWSASASVLSLVSTTQEREMFALSATSSIALLEPETDRTSCEGNAGWNCSLTREPRARMPVGSYRIRGIYSQQGTRRRLQPCGSAISLLAETSGRPLLLQRLSQAVAGGKPALVTVTGSFEKTAPAHAAEAVHIASVLTAQAGAICPKTLEAPELGMSGEQKPPPLPQDKPATRAALSPGTTWVLIQIDHASPPAGIGEGEASIRFLQDGRVSGFTGCNRFSGPYALTGRSIRFGPIVTTRMACPVSANIEVPYTRALEAARHIDLQGDALYLLNGAGHRIAAFRAVRLRP